MSFQTIRVRYEEDICFLQLYRPEANNTINSLLINECNQVLKECLEKIKIIVLEGLPNVFSLGADFNIATTATPSDLNENDPESLYNLWARLASGPFITIAHVRGKVNAGGIGFVAASDIALADENAEFSLSELLFGLIPACVMPFLIRRIGFQKANYMTLMTKPFSVYDASLWGLVDAYEKNSVSLLRKHLLRLRVLDKASVIRHKNYINTIDDSITKYKKIAIKNNLEVFRDPANHEKISRYITTGKFPWEK